MNSLLLNIIKLPRDFHKGNKSIYTLLSESGYFKYYDSINEANIAAALDKHLDLIDEWEMWSEDKRTTDGWWLSVNKGKPYKVGYYPQDNESPILEFSEKKDACAAFIKREIESIRVRAGVKPQEKEVNKYHVVIGRPVDYEFLIVDIKIDDKYIARLQKEEGNDKIVIEFFEETALQKVYLSDFIEALQFAKEELLK